MTHQWRDQSTIDHALLATSNSYQFVNGASITSNYHNGAEHFRRLIMALDHAPITNNHFR
jgi:hypothetical protein